MFRIVRKWLALEGRGGRLEFCMVGGVAFLWMAGWVAYLELYGPEKGEYGWGMIGFFVFVVIIPGLAFLGAAARRLHDLNRSVMWIFALTLGVKLSNAFYENMDPGVSRAALIIAGSTVVTAFLATLALKGGTVGPNHFGPDPFERRPPSEADAPRPSQPDVSER